MNTVSRAPGMQSSIIGLSHAALLLILSDTLLQGSRFVFILYLGSYSLSVLGAFLFGTAMGALLSVVVDFGINQHWIRLKPPDASLNSMVFTRVFLAKMGWSVLGMVVIMGLAAAGAWRIAPVPVMGAGLVLTVLQMLSEACEAIGLAFRWYRLVSLLRAGLSLALYAVPLAMGWALKETVADAALYVVLPVAAMAGTMILIGYAWYIGQSLPHNSPVRIGYGAMWWNARWLGMNQAAIVVDVRSPLVILGIMLGETAVGVYGLVQRTTAIVELAWASLSKLLLKSYADTAFKGGFDEVRSRMVAASRLTGLVMAGATLLVWMVTKYIEQSTEWSVDMLVALALLRWSMVAISLSSVKRPFISGLLALNKERAVCRINVISAVAGVALIPLLILSHGVWGPVIGWILLEAAAGLLLIHLLFSIRGKPRSKLDETLSRHAGI